MIASVSRVNLNTIGKTGHRVSLTAEIMLYAHFESREGTTMKHGTRGWKRGEGGGGGGDERMRKREGKNEGENIG